MKGDGATAVTVMPDYQGPIQPFALITVVPGDVDIERVTTLKREFVDRVDTVSAPRFSEFWEMDPCEPGKAEQEWERDMTAKADTGFMGVMQTDPSKKVAKELLVDVTAKQKEGEYKISILDSWDQLSKWLSDKGYKAPEGTEAALKPYLDAGMKLLVADVDANRIELVGGDRAQLSPIRFWTEGAYDTIPARLGLVSAPEKQELLVYVLDPKSRSEVKNYPTKFAPTNLTVDFEVKERMGEFYAGLHDLFLAKNPGTFLTEFAWPTGGCGQPCASEALLPHELVSLGGDVFDSKLDDEVRNPDPGKPTEEEKAKFEASVAEKNPKEKREAKKAWEEERKTLAARRALLDRHKYILTRVHYRYGKDELPKDPKIGPAEEAVTGGVDLPQGKDGAASTKVEPSDQNEFQTRYNNLHPNKTVVKCESPENYRWGKAPRTYRGLRKIWVAEDLTRKNRKQIDPVAMVQTSVPELGLGVAKKEPEKAAPPADAAAEKKDDSCGCRAAGLPQASGVGVWAALLGGIALWRRRRAIS